MSSPSQFYWPFAQGATSALPAILTYDLVIQEPYPGIVLYPTAPGGVYQEIREVDGILWLVTNAMWNPNTLQWEQDTPCNPTLPAYALKQHESGNLTRSVAVATGAINTAVAWIPVWAIDEYGDMQITPVTLTAEGQVIEQLNATWDAGGAAQMVAREVNITDTSSASTSYLDQLSVGGVAQWAVDKGGVLRVGVVPPGLISPTPIAAIEAGLGITVTTNENTALISVSHGDYVDLSNTQTITGVKTLTDVAGLLIGSTTGSEGSITAGAYGTAMAFGAKFSVAPFTWQAEATKAAIICASTANTTENPSGFDFYFDTGLTPGNTYIPTLVFSVDYTGSISTGTVSASTLASEMEGTDGVVVSYDGGTQKVDINGSAFITAATSPDNAVTVAIVGQTLEISGNAEATGYIPVGGTVVDTGNGLTLPGPNTWNWLLRYVVNIEPGENTFFLTNLAVTSGTVTDTQIVNAGNQQNNINGGFIGSVLCLAVGGQEVIITDSGTGGYGSSSQYFTAIRQS